MRKKKDFSADEYQISAAEKGLISPILSGNTHLILILYTINTYEYINYLTDNSYSPSYSEFITVVSF